VKHVVIVGGGFAGLNCAKKLAHHPDVRVTLIDKNNYQQFQPLLYQVAGAALSPSNIAFNLRSVLRDHPNVDVKMSEVTSVDLTLALFRPPRARLIKAIFWCWPRDRKPFLWHAGSGQA